MVPLFSGNSYLAAVLAVYRTVLVVALNADSQKMFARRCTARECFQKIAFTFTPPYLQGFQGPFPAFDVSQTFHTKFVKAMWNVCGPSRTQETPANLYLQGLPASTVKVKGIFWKRKKHLQSLCKCLILHVWTSQGLNLGPPDYESVKVRFFKISQNIFLISIWLFIRYLLILQPK